MKKSIFLSHVIEIANVNGLSVSDAFNLVENLGYDGLDVDYELLYNYRNEILKSKLVPVNVYALFNFNISDEVEKLNRFFSDVKSVGCKTVMIIPLTDGDDGTGFNKAVLGLQTACDVSKKYGITVTIEPFDFDTSYTCYYKNLKTFLNKVNDLKLTFDTGNFLYDGISFETAFSELKDKIVHVHLKDRTTFSISNATKLFYMANGKGYYSAPVNEGVMGIENIIKLLKSINYKGYVTAEHFCAGNQLEYVKRSIKNVSELIKD